MHRGKVSGKENNSSVKRKRRRNYFLYRRVNVYVSIMCVDIRANSFYSKVAYSLFEEQSESTFIL